MTFLALVIFVLLLVAGLFTDGEFDYSSNLGVTITTLWIIFVVISFLYSVNGILINRGFDREIHKFAIAGKPIKGIRGFSELSGGLKNARNMSILITLASILSFGLYASISILDSGDGKAVLSGRGLATLAVTMILIAISVVFLIELPRETALDPGGLVGFYEPDVFPFSLDNILSGVFLTYIDPVTFMEIDEYLKELGQMLEPEFEADETFITRVERAFEKILLIAYLSISIPEVITKEVIRNEIVELIGDDDFQSFYEGNKTGLSWNELVKIVEKIEEQAPEAFRLVDRLLVNLMDNYEAFTSHDLYYTISAETNQGSIKESSGAIMYFLNNTEQTDRFMVVKFRSDRNSIHPDYQEIRIGLDTQTDPYPEQQPPFFAAGNDILSILSTILQVGDAVWFRFKPTGFGFRVITIQAEEEKTGRVFGQSMEMKFTKSISWYFKSYAPKLSALGGVLLPVIQGFLGLT
jgi:hypothetical protein